MYSLVVIRAKNEKSALLCTHKVVTSLKVCIKQQPKEIEQASCI